MNNAKSPLLQQLQQAFKKASRESSESNSSKHPFHTNHGRRRFIKQTALTGINIAFFSQLNGCTTAREEILDVAIIGGGIAGLHAGHILKKKKINFKIFEAANRVGGRIMTSYETKGDGTYFEMGGEFIDSNHTDMVNLCKEFNLELLDCVADTEKSKLIKDAYFFGGRHYTEDEVIAEFKKYTSKILEDKMALEEEDDTKLELLDNLSITEYMKKIGVSGWFYDMLNVAFTSEMGMEASEQSALNLIDMLDTDTSEGFKIFGDSDERFKIKGGNSSITEALKKSLNDEIKFNKALSAITQADKLIELEFSDETKVKAKYVILALPFSILRTLTLPSSWPKEKIKVIQELGYGTNGKYFIGFNKRPWREQNYAGYLFNETIHNGWESTLLQNSNTGKSIYTVFLGGAAGENVQTSEVDKYLTTLDGIFTQSRASAEGIKSSFNWTNNIYSRGSYAAYKKGQWMSVAGEEIKPVENVFFAGEHCSENFQGYMNGGAETGRAAAEQVIERMAIK